MSGLGTAENNTPNVLSCCCMAQLDLPYFRTTRIPSAPAVGSFPNKGCGAACCSVAAAVASPHSYVFGQNMTEHNPALSPSGHPLLSGPPTLNHIHQIFGHAAYPYATGPPSATLSMLAAMANFEKEAPIAVPRYRGRIPTSSAGDVMVTRAVTNLEMPHTILECPP